MGRFASLPPMVPTLDTRTARPLEKATDPFYKTADWREFIQQIIVVRGARCEDPQCKTPNRIPTRIFGDHIKELRDGGARLDPANIMLRCGSCHTRKTLEERARRMADTI